MADTLEIFGTEYTGVTGIIATNDQSTDLTYIRPQGTKSITQNGTGIDVASFASVDVNVSGGGQPTLQTKTKTYTPTTSQQTESVMADSGYDGLDAVNVTVNAMPMGAIASRAPINYLVAEASFDSQTGMFTAVAEIAEVINPVTQSGYVTTGAETELEANASDTYQLTMRSSSDLTASGATVTVPSGYYSAQASKAVASGTAGTPTATKGTVSNHSVSVTPSVTNTSGYITGSTKTGTAVTVSASELVSGSETKTENGTYDVTNLAQLVVNVPSGSSKNTQVVQGTTRTNASTLTAIGSELTVSKTGTYDIYYSCFRTNTSASYTWATRLYINGTAYGTAENTTWTNNQQNTHLSNISLTAGDKLRVYGRETRGTSHYVCAPTLAIVEA